MLISSSSINTDTFLPFQIITRPSGTNVQIDLDIDINELENRQLEEFGYQGINTWIDTLL